MAAPAADKAHFDFEEPSSSASRPTQIPLMMIDGLRVDAARVNFAGSVTINLDNLNDREFFNELLLGRSVRLVVEAYVASTSGKAPRDKEGAVKSVDKPVSLRIHSIFNDSLSIVETP